MNVLQLLADAEIAARHDPTWIYSTLAQTAGALVGLLGAVLVSRVVSHMASLQPDVFDIRGRIHNALGRISGVRTTIIGRVNESSFGPEGMTWYKHLAAVHSSLPEGEVNEKELTELVTRLNECVTAFPEASANQALR